MIDFTDQAVVVTGAGRGLGRLYALDLAGRGASVVVNDLGTTMSGSGTDSSVADAVVDEIEGAGDRAVASHHSVAELDSAKEMVDLAIENFGHVDAVVSNAGGRDVRTTQLGPLRRSEGQHDRVGQGHCHRWRRASPTPSGASAKPDRPPSRRAYGRRTAPAGRPGPQGLCVERRTSG